MLHYHCKECAKEDTPQFFKSKEELDNHLTTAHTKWWFEKRCKYDMECQGQENGSCGFNHHPLHDPSANFLPTNMEIPDTICSFDKPWDNKRCKNFKCNMDHFWGRVRWMITQRKVRHQKERTTPTNAYPMCASNARPMHPERPDFSDDAQATFDNFQTTPLTAEAVYETQLAARALLRDMHEAGFLDNKLYYNEFQHSSDVSEVNEELCANAYGELSADAYEEDDNQETGDNYQEEEDEYADMPPLIPFYAKTTA
jgi:hypothetical protein